MNWMKIYKEKKTMLILVLVVILGILFMLYQTPVKSAEQQTESISENNNDIEKRLESILSKVKGAGKVNVMINFKGGSEKIIAYNSDKESENRDDGYKINEKNEMAFSRDQPVVIKEIYPEIEGVLIVAEGGGNNQIKNDLIRATMALLGVDMNKIEVLIMKKEA
jgi:hypothetical protein